MGWFCISKYKANHSKSSANDVDVHVDTSTIVYSNSSLLASKCRLSCLPNKEFLVKDIKKLVHKYLIYLLKNSLNSNHARANNYAWTEVLLMLSKWQITHFHSVALSKKVQLLGRHTVSLRWCARAQQIFEKILVLSSFNWFKLIMDLHLYKAIPPWKDAKQFPRMFWATLPNKISSQPCVGLANRTADHNFFPFIFSSPTFQNKDSLEMGYNDG